LSTSEDWQGEIDLVFTALVAGCEILLTPGCSIHVHVSPRNVDGFNNDQLKQIIKQVIYYDNPLTTILPPDRKHNEWAMSNVKKTPG
jgi:hypothetical protein